jgi:hypothetical protein
VGKEVLSNDAFSGNPFGFGTGFSGGYPQTVAPPFSQVSDPSTMFTNLRWFFVSNFRQVLSQAYVELGLVQTVVDLPVDDALRGGIAIRSGQLSDEQIADLQTSVDRDDDLRTVGQAAKWMRLFGGAGILIITDQDPEQPFNIKEITKDSPLEFRAVDLWELFWDQQNIDGYDPQVQSENFEEYSYYATKMHRSRVMRLKGLTAPSFLRPRLRGWGFSVVEILVRSINQYLKATDLGFEVLDEFKLDVFKIKNLVNTLLSPNGAEKIHQRVTMANWQKNFQNAIVMDSEDDFDHKQLSFSGLAEAMEGIRMQVAADMRMPITKLFGTSASAGIGNTDQNDMENYNAMVDSQVRSKIKYDILRVLEIKCQKLFGMVPDDLSIEFAPLRVLTAEQEENVKNAKHNRLLLTLQAGALSMEQFLEACNKEKLLSIQVDVIKESLTPDVGAEGELPGHDSEDPGANKKDTRRPQLSDNNKKEKSE